MTTLTPHSTRSAVLTVAEVIEETADARSIVFDVPEEIASRFGEYRPGQFLTVRIPSDRTGSVARCYSLSSSPFSDPRPKVTVKRTAEGYGSNWLCDKVTAGSEIEVLPPSGVFTPHDLDSPLLLLAAGSGITPIMSILKAALEKGTAPIVVVYANRGENDVIFAAELRTLAAAHARRLTVIHWLESVQGLPTADALSALVAPFSGHSAFMCGPAPFMDAVHTALSAAGFPHDHVHAEVFTSLSGDPFDDPDLEAPTDEETADAATVSVELDGTVHELSWPRSKTLVDIMLAAGLDVPYSCREGECGSCACTVVDGTVQMDNVGALDQEDIDDGYILGCQARPTSDALTIEF
ncbi:ferredoxin--NADP reductase [Williamsia deligens]|uniref:2Fe-2S iron-sulfur cluster-binding protein n=1 Tax=Williamsia deligens TaxID=321325 RepID=A0ABW3G3J2_9NOCA|nr:ferredoxin--NADP reductase [Williamsia deligens]MCP2194689.1 3-ketosteroid 9alpha-monooxygenase subunit B [Williamsia deligens]